MQSTTTVRVSQVTRDHLRALAKDDGLTLDEEMSRLVRAERQRRMGQALAATEPDSDDQAWLDLSVEAARADASR